MKQKRTKINCIQAFDYEPFYEINVSAKGILHTTGSGFQYSGIF